MKRRVIFENILREPCKLRNGNISKYEEHLGEANRKGYTK